LKSEVPVEEELFLIWEEMMAQAGEIVFRKREAFISEFIPIFQSFYSFISQDKEQVGLTYDSHARDASLLDVIKASRVYLPEVITGYQLDDLLYAGSIQFIEDIIQQKQRYCGAGPFQEIKLCQFQGNKIGFVLPLRTFPLHKVGSDYKMFQVDQGVITEREEDEA